MSSLHDAVHQAFAATLDPLHTREAQEALKQVGLSFFFVGCMRLFRAHQ